ncbi:MAG: septal ring lytic transglycosylase RlpA family protein [Alphaproteobacteria bacterium]|nr:septal ring lytic transglycosylase RlpA family protein [Alphaproteobacteria bacterium]
MVQAVGQQPEAIPQTRYVIGVPYRINGVWYYPAENFGYDQTGIASYYGGERSGVDFHGRLTANGEVYDMNTMTAAHQTLPLPTIVRVTHLENGRSIVVRINDRGPFANNRIIDLSRRSAQLLGFERSGVAPVRVQIMADESRRVRDALVAGQPPPSVPELVAAAQTDAPPSRPAQLPSPQDGRPGVPTDLATAPGPQAPPPPPSPPTASARQPSSRASIFIQAGAFQNQRNADQLGARLARMGRIQVSSVRAAGSQLYRVRMGPFNSGAEADRALRRVATIAPQARIVIE